MNFRIKILFILLSFTLIADCKEEMKVCISQSPDIRIKLYNELTDQLIGNFYDDYYLGERKKYFDSLRIASRNNNDEVYNKEHTKAHNQIFNNEKKQCVLYLDSVKIKNTYISRYNNEARIKILKDNTHFFSGFSNKMDVLKSLCKRSTVKANDFNQCAVEVLDLEKKDKNKKDCEAGIVYYSEILFDNSKKNALVFVNYRNTHRVFRNCIVKLELVNNYWEIKDSILLAIS